MEMMTIIVCVVCVLWIVLGPLYMIFDYILYNGFRDIALEKFESRVLFVRAIDMIRIANIISDQYTQKSARHTNEHFKDVRAYSPTCEVRRHLTVTTYWIDELCIARRSGTSEQTYRERVMLPASAIDLVVWLVYYKMFSHKWR